jgi:glycosyltransferase involved in cell wall biosynthesis
MFYRTMYFILCLFVLPSLVEGAGEAKKTIEFAVVVPSYNNEKWCIQNLESITGQTYPHWTLYYINDCSSDRTGQIVEEFIYSHGIEHKCVLVNNTTRKLAMANLYETIHTIHPQKIIVICDGDDWMANNKVLEKLSDVYSNKNIWMTYGNYQTWPHKGISCCELIPKNVQKNKHFRSYKWVASHLRTFYAKLFQNIKMEDLTCNDGEFFPMTYDLAIMFPMLEMASNDHYLFIPDILYIYNYDNPINDHRVNLQLQEGIEKYIRSLPTYNTIETLF